MKQVQRGFTLIELLVSIFVLALGVTGAMLLQLSSTRQMQQSALRQRAVIFASSVAEQLHANLPENPEGWSTEANAQLPNAALSWHGRTLSLKWQGSGSEQQLQQSIAP